MFLCVECVFFTFIRLIHSRWSCGFKPRIVPLNFLELHSKFIGEGKHGEEGCTNLRCNSVVSVKFPIHIEPA